MSTTTLFQPGSTTYRQVFEDDTFWASDKGRDLPLVITESTSTSVCLNGQTLGIYKVLLTCIYVRAPDPAEPENKNRWLVMSPDMWNKAIARQQTKQ